MFCVNRTDSSQYSLPNDTLEVTFKDVVNQDADVYVYIANLAKYSRSMYVLYNTESHV